MYYIFFWFSLNCSLLVAINLLEMSHTDKQYIDACLYVVCLECIKPPAHTCPPTPFPPDGCLRTGVEQTVKAQ